jgi:hypothetical protein
MSWPVWQNWGPDDVERDVGEKYIPGILQEYGDFKNAIHPEIDHPLWYALAYYNLSTFYNLAHAKYCIINISKLDETFNENRINAIYLYDFFISGFFLSLRTAVDTLAAQIHLIFAKEVPFMKNILNITSRKSQGYTTIIKNAEEDWYNEFNLYRNHLDHGFFLIRAVYPAVLLNINILYPNGTSKNLDVGILLKIYKDQMVHGGTPDPSNYMSQTAVDQCESYLKNAIQLTKDVFNLLKNDYARELKPHMLSEISSPKGP